MANNITTEDIGHNPVQLKTTETGGVHTLHVLAANADGSAKPQGRAAAASSSPVVLSNEDKAALDAAMEYYTTVAVYAGATTAGRAVAIIATVAGTATLTLVSGSITIPIAVGLTLVPFACTNAVQASGTMTLYKLT